MALYNQSTITWKVAVQRVADSIGASADTEMTERAHNSLRAAFQFLGGTQRWDFLRTESAPISVSGTFGVTGVSASAGQASAAAPTNHGFKVDDRIIGDGFALGMRVTATGANAVGLATAITGLAAGVNVITATAIRDFYDLPTDVKMLYSVRLLDSSKPLRYMGRRFYDRTVGNEDTLTTPTHYDLFSMGGKGKIRLLGGPSGNNTLFLRYYRRFTLASASSITTTALDIPEDWEEVPIAWAKWHFLTDKGEGRKDQAATWMSLAQDGLKQMLQEQANLPDEDLAIVPGHVVGGFDNPNSTANLPYDYS